MVDSRGEEWKTQGELGTSGGLLKKDRDDPMGFLMVKTGTISAARKIAVVLNFEPENKIYKLQTIVQ